MLHIRVSQSTYDFLKQDANDNATSMLDRLNFIIETFKLISTKIVLPPNSKRGKYSTCMQACKFAFYEFKKSRLEGSQIKFYAPDSKYFSLLFENYKKEFLIFKEVFRPQFLKQRAEEKKEKLKEYNKQYYLKKIQCL